MALDLKRDRQASSDVAASDVNRENDDGSRLKKKKLCHFVSELFDVFSLVVRLNTWSFCELF